VTRNEVREHEAIVALMVDMEDRQRAHKCRGDRFLET